MPTAGRGEYERKKHSGIQYEVLSGLVEKRKGIVVGVMKAVFAIHKYGQYTMINVIWYLMRGLEIGPWVSAMVARYD